MSLHRLRTTHALGRCGFLLGALAFIACSDVTCPVGTTEKLGRCIPDSDIADAEVGTAGEQAATGSAVSGAGAGGPGAGGARIRSEEGVAGASGGNGERDSASREQSDSGNPGLSGAAQGGSAASAGAGAMEESKNEAGMSGGADGPGAAPRCGNGVVDAGETCDGDCPKSCPAANGCSTSKLTGSATTCDAECMMMEITATIAGDGCCPTGSNASADTDCPAKCGDKILDSNEKCEVGSAELPCPTSCDDADPCTKDVLVGSAAQCTAVCTNTMIVRPMNGDMCCPAGANAETDSDCPTRCGTAQ